jgi:DeoR family suf operon transcriptional repressor
VPASAPGGLEYTGWSNTFHGSFAPVSMSFMSSSPPGSVSQQDVQAPGLSQSQQRVLGRLKRTGATTIPALAGELALNVETVRHHLRALEGLGYVERQGTRRPRPGRPEVLYALTAQAERLFPSRQGEVLRDLADYLEATGNAELIDEFFDRWIASRRPAALARVEGLTGDARLREVAAIMSELGFMASAEVEDGGRLHLCNCPLRDLVEVSKVPCRAEIGFIRELLGERLTRLAYIPAGDTSCSYRPAIGRPPRPAPHPVASA